MGRKKRKKVEKQSRPGAYQPDWRPVAYLDKSQGWHRGDTLPEKPYKKAYAKPRKRTLPNIRAGVLQVLKSIAGSGEQIDPARLALLRALFERFGRRLRSGEKCVACGNTATQRHHKRPLGRGGTNRDENIVGLCERCHAEVHPWLDMPDPPWLASAKDHLSACSAAV